MDASKLLRLCDYIFVLRPLLLTPAWSFYLLGAGEVARGSSRPLLIPPSPATIISLTFILTCGYLINQIFDRESDRVNKKVFFLAEGIFSTWGVLAMAVISFLAASYFFHRSPSMVRTPLLLALVLALTYSLPPIRLCSRPFFDTAANAVGFGGLAFVLGYAAGAGRYGRSPLLAAPYVLLVASTFLLTAVLDYEGDRQVGKTSSAVRLGKKSALRVAALLGVGAFISSLACSHMFAAALTLLALPAPFYARQGDRKRVSLAVQATTMLVILAASSQWPLYLAAIIPLVVLSRYYYRRRFGLIYPGVTKGT